jgi:hypothetical protein
MESREHFETDEFAANQELESDARKIPALFQKSFYQLVSCFHLAVAQKDEGQYDFCYAPGIHCVALSL